MAGHALDLIDPLRELRSELAARHALVWFSFSVMASALPSRGGSIEFAGDPWTVEATCKRSPLLQRLDGLLRLLKL